MLKVGDLVRWDARRAPPEGHGVEKIYLEESKVYRVSAVHQRWCSIVDMNGKRVGSIEWRHQGGSFAQRSFKLV
jgi:hypothetical protein